MREKKIHKIETHVAGVVFDGDKVFIAKRSPERKIYPNYWECGGGQVHPGESFEEALQRQYLEEFGMEVNVLYPFKTYVIEKEQKIPGIRFICTFKRFVKGKPKLSAEHTECKFVNVEELQEYNLIPGLLDDILLARKLFEFLNSRIDKPDI